MTHGTTGGRDGQQPQENRAAFRFSSEENVEDLGRTSHRPRRTWIVLVVLLVGVAGFFAIREFNHHGASARRRPKGVERRPRPRDVGQVEKRRVTVLLDNARSSLQSGDTSAAESDLRTLLAESPSDKDANELLCVILRCGGRNWEARPHVLELMRNDVFRTIDLITLTSSKLEIGPDEESVIRQAQTNKQSLAQLSEAQHLLDHNLHEKALPLLERIVDDDADQLQAQARLGGVLLTTNRPAEFRQWQRRLPSSALTHPEIWMVRGIEAEDKGEKQAAAFCYWEVLKRHPDHPSATYRLSQQLRVSGRTSDAAYLGDRAKRLAALETAIVEARARKERIEDVAERLETLGRLWESLGWCMIAKDRGGKQSDLGWADERIARLRKKITLDTPLVLDSQNTANKLDLTAWSPPPWNAAPRDSSDGVAPAASRQIQFVDSADEAGIAFSYFNGADPERAFMFEFSGGGVAVLDYDADGWPDIYLTQGCPWPVEPQTRNHDRLFRNLGDGRFADVTRQAGLLATGYGQGVTAGDFNNDGLPDLYIANIGPNQLYRNNGDGTFTDHSSGLQGAKWTISTLIADLDADRLPDLYDVNYLGGPKVFTEICHKYGGPVQCYPTQFPAETDMLYRNLGEGSFRDVSDDAGIIVPDGKGMGIVAADFDGSRRLSLFIANDTTENFLFSNQSRPGSLLFSEQGMMSGVAMNKTGLSASCMGIATGDVNGDGRLDLFVTNFQVEPNNLYVQIDNLQFDDQIRRSRLYDPGFLLEGWGAQFLDGDLDGQLDLVVANGHLHNYPHSPNENQMPTQFFRNTGDARFADVPAKELGPYFESKRLGRAIARLDWNRDGRPDFCVTHVDAPFALLTNQTPQTGHYLAIQLRGVESSRDAIGATVIVRAGDRSWSRQLAAGGGFSASNERQLVFGLGPVGTVDQLIIQWPVGTDQTFSNLEVDRELIFIEGQSEPYHLVR
jgi:tetratricopeptide (TPR) repeat protein